MICQAGVALVQPGVAASPDLLIVSSSNYPLDNTITTAQKIFNSPTNGAIALAGNTTYLFEGLVRISGMSGTSGNGFIDILGAGTATITTCHWVAYGTDSTGMTQAAVSLSAFVAAAGSGNMFTSATTTGMMAFVKGVVRINAAGTMIPSVGLTNTSSATVLADSYFRFTPVGSGTVVNVGNWS